MSTYIHTSLCTWKSFGPVEGIRWDTHSLAETDVPCSAHKKLAAVIKNMIQPITRSTYTNTLVTLTCQVAVHVFTCKLAWYCMIDTRACIPRELIASETAKWANLPVRFTQIYMYTLLGLYSFSVPLSLAPSFYPLLFHLPPVQLRNISLLHSNSFSLQAWCLRHED